MSVPYIDRMIQQKDTLNGNLGWCNIIISNVDISYLDLAAAKQKRTLFYNTLNKLMRRNSLEVGKETTEICICGQAKTPMR